MNERILDYVAWVLSGCVLLVVVYLASAPPIMMAMFKASGGHIPALYLPVVWLIESHFNGPFLWYFNDVWGCGIELLGESTTPWYVVLTYCVIGITASGVVAFPAWRRKRKARAT